MLSGYLLSTSVKFPCSQNTFRQFRSTLFHIGFPSTSSTFCAAKRTSVNFPRAGTPSINFRQLYVQPGDLPSPFANFTCVRPARRPCQLLSIFRNARRLSVKIRLLSVLLGGILSTSINFPSILEKFCQLPSTFCAARRPVTI